MSIAPLPVESVAGAFLLTFPALFSVINPLGSALVFYNLTQARSHPERVRLARRVGLYSLLVLLGSLLLGGYILNFFGVSLGALRVGGGLVVAVTAWKLLTEGQSNDVQASAETEPAARQRDDIAFFPLTTPLTTGPGSISVAVALASQRPLADSPTSFFVGAAFAAAANALLVVAIYTGADRVLRRLGEGGARGISRGMAFILLCIGVQIMSTGVESLVRPWLK